MLALLQWTLGGKRSRCAIAGPDSRGTDLMGIDDIDGHHPSWKAGGRTGALQYVSDISLGVKNERANARRRRTRLLSLRAKFSGASGDKEKNSSHCSADLEQIGNHNTRLTHTLLKVLNIHIHTCIIPYLEEFLYQKALEGGSLSQEVSELMHGWTTLTPYAECFWVPQRRTFWVIRR